MKLNRRGFVSLLAGAGVNLGSWSKSFSFPNPLNDESLLRRQAYLAELLRILPHTRWPLGRITAQERMWEDWLKRSEELPPDFSLMNSIVQLPDPLMIRKGGVERRVASVGEWEEQRRWLKEQLQHWVVGTMPPPPDNLEATIVSSERDGDVLIQDVRLEFGPGRKGSLDIQLQIPPGDGPFPVFLTTHGRKRPWVNVAVRRGYIGCFSNAASTIYVQKDQADPWLDIYPEYEWGAIARWAWGLMRAVDYLHTLPKVDREKIAVSGHSRNAKLSLITAAFDERIGAVVPSRGNTGESIPFRHANETFHNESMEEITRYFSNWFHPRLRFFVGRPHKLPVDANCLGALVAPRPMLISQAFTEHQGNPWAVEQSFRSVREVYRFLNAEDNLGLYQRPSAHPSSPEDFEIYLDFFDNAFGRNRFPRPEIWVNGYTFEDWKSRGGIEIDLSQFEPRRTGDFLKSPQGSISEPGQWLAGKASIQKRTEWLLGETPPGFHLEPQKELDVWGWRGYRTAEGALARGLDRPDRTSRMDFKNISFGDDLTGRLYYPITVQGDFKMRDIFSGDMDQRGRNFKRVPRQQPGELLPAVVWLHPYSYATGYGQLMEWLFGRLTQAGFAVVGFDQIGFGSRVDQAKNFYRRFPKWSLMSKMVVDVRSMIDKLQPLEMVDPDRIFLLGFSLGAQVALLTASLDERVSGLACASGFSPLRLTDPSSGSEGIRHYSHLHGTIPRMGYFLGNEDRLPVDFDELMAAVAPRPLYVLAPTLDRYHPVDHVSRAVEEARKVYALLGQPEALQLETPEGFAGFTLQRPWQEKVVDWLTQQAGLSTSPGSA